MQVYRALSSCPNCFTTHEIWNYKSKVSPQEKIACTSCERLFEPGSFIFSFIELYSNNSISAVNIASSIEIFLPVS